MNEALSYSLQLVLGILRSENELAKLGGRHWPALAWRLRAEAAVLEPWDEKMVPVVAERMLEAVSEYLPWVSEDWLRAAGDPELIEAREARTTRPTEILRNARRWISSWTQPREEPYQFIIDSPEKLALASVAELVVTVEPPNQPRDEAKIEGLQPGIDLRFRLHGVGVTAHPAESVHPLKDDLESLHVAFQIRSVRAGRGALILEVTQGRHLIFSQQMAIETYLPTAESREISGKKRVRSTCSVSTGRTVAPTAELLISSYMTSPSEYFVHFDFENPQGFKVSGTKRITSSIEGYWKSLRKDLELVCVNEEGRAALRQIGQRLFLELFPEELSPALGHLLNLEIGTVQVQGDNLWIPWEILVPAGPFFGQERSTFLGEHFAIARWCQPGNGGTRPKDLLDLQNARLLIPKVDDLPGASQEKSWLIQELNSRGICHSPVSPANRATTLQHLGLGHSPPVDLWHFGGHGKLDSKDADRAVLLLENGDQIKPLDILGDTATSLRQARPLVFLNACGVGLGGWGITSMGGWMYRLVGQAGVGAVIAPMWSVTDDESFQFMQAFYRSLPGDDNEVRTLGEAVQQARIACGLSTTAMSYVAYGDVNARIGLSIGLEGNR